MTKLLRVRVVEDGHPTHASGPLISATGLRRPRLARSAGRKGPKGPKKPARRCRAVLADVGHLRLVLFVSSPRPKG
jgi:hypothetical protein